jgi:hypothetical protein
MGDSEKKLKQEDCHEDSLGAGYLTLTDSRIVFDKRSGRIMDFSTKIGETLIDAPLSDVVRVWKEGLFMKKVCIRIKTKEGEKDYKFGVFNNGSWLNSLEEALEAYRNQ